MLRTILKCELAKKYGWQRQTLMLRVHRDSELMRDLKGLKYKKTQKTFTPKQIASIYRHLGCPEDEN